MCVIKLQKPEREERYQFDINVDCGQNGEAKGLGRSA